MTKINTNQINLGNESAVDLLIERNVAKQDLATNLQGKGVSADASTETLGQLVNKVPNILSASNEELIECITTDLTANNITWDNNNMSFARINGYLFFTKIGDWRLSCIKISEIEQAMPYDQQTNVANIITSANNTYASIYPGNIFSSPDFTKIYVFGNYSGFWLFDAVWDGDTITSLTYNTFVNLTGNKIINAGDINSTGDKIIYIKDGSNSIWLYDLVNETNTEIFNTDILQHDAFEKLYSCSSIKWVGNNEIVFAACSKSRYVKVLHFSIDGTIATLIANKNGQIQAGNSKFTATYLFNRTTLVEYSSGKYKFIIPLEPYIQSYDALKLAIYDTYTKELIEYNKNIRHLKCFNNISNLNSPCHTDITYNSTYHRWILSVGWDFYIFDDNFELKSAMSTNCLSTGDYLNGSIFISDNSIYSPNSGTFGQAIKVQYWLNKKTITKRTVSINEEQKDFYYTPEIITVSDIENGYFD